MRFFICFFLIINFSNIFSIIAQQNTDQLLKTNNDMKDSKHGVKMGQVFVGCDDAKTDLELDWNDSPLNYTCYRNIPFEIDSGVKTIVQCDNVPEGYMPQHFCMKDRIIYNESLPTHGDHRPLWPVFGEYSYVPAQRWLHNIEHGAIVMVYHPCTHPFMINKLKKLVKNCVRKHIITPDAFRMTSDRPLALIAWGCRMLMNQVDSHQVISFIRKHALHGPEGTYSSEGQYTKRLVEKARVPVGSTYEDDILCPFSFR